MNAEQLITVADMMLQRKPLEEDLESERWKNDVVEYLISIGEYDKAKRVRNRNLINAFGEAESDMCIIKWNKKNVSWIVETLKGATK